MSWVKRVLPGDQDYFCGCPPCPFCYQWVDDDDADQPEKRDADQPRKRHALPLPRMRWLLVPVLVCVGFFLTMGVTLRHQQRPATPQNKYAPPTDMAVPPVTTLVDSSEPQTAPQSEIKLTGSPAASPPTAAREETAADAATPAEPEEQPVPVSFHFARSPDQSGVTVTLRNSAKGAQHVSVTALDPRTGNRSTVWVNMPGYSWANLNEAGLIAQHGDELMAESPGYLARTGITVP
jgi:hypothetical protein